MLLEELPRLFRLRDMPRRVEVFRAALTMIERDTQPELWAALHVGLASSLAQNPLGPRAANLEEAIAHFGQALELRTPAAFPQDCRDTAYMLGLLLFDMDRVSAARHALGIAHQAVEMLRGEASREGAKQALAEENANLYAILVLCCLLENDEAAAFTYAAAGKGRAFVDLLASARFDLSTAGADSPPLAADLDRYRALRQQVDALLSRLPGDGRRAAGEEVEADRRSAAGIRDELRAAQQRAAAYWVELTERYPALTATEQTPALSAADARSLAGTLRATLVEYVRHAGGWGAFVITPEQVRYLPLPRITDRLLQRMATWSAHVRHPISQGPWSYELLDDWHTAIVAPLRPYLPAGGSVVLAPFAQLHLLPLAACRNPDTGRYLAEDYTLAFAPGLAALRVARDQARLRAAPGNGRSPDRLLGFAYPAREGTRNYLPFVVPEAAAVAARFAPHVTLLYDDNATVVAVLTHAKETPHHLVHVGCHGHFNATLPEASGLALKDGWLTVQRIIAEWHLEQTRLATLAACQTGQIGVRQGEEHSGLVQAVMIAGARAVFASLWSVSDAATSAFFQAFYAVLAGGHSPAVALAAAARFVRSHPRWTHPYYWAAFQSSGLAFEPVGPPPVLVPDDVEASANEIIERTRGGLVMNADNAVDNAIHLLTLLHDQLTDEPADRLASLAPASQATVVAGMQALHQRAAEVDDETDLRAVAGDVYELFADTPALRDWLLSADFDLAAVRDQLRQPLAAVAGGETPRGMTAADDQAANKQDQYWQRRAQEIVNQVVEIDKRLNDIWDEPETKRPADGR